MRRRYRGPASNLENTAVAPCIVSQETHQHGKQTMNSILRRAPAENIPTRLALRHSRQWVFCSVTYNPSTSLRSLCSIPVTGLPRCYGRSDSCSVGSSVPYRQHENRLCSEQVSLLHAPELPIPPSPTTYHPSDIAFARYPSACRTSRYLGSGLHLSLAGSPVWSAESSSLSYGWIVRLLLLPTPPHDDAVTVGYRPENVCLKGTCTPLFSTYNIVCACRRTSAAACRRFGMRLRRQQAAALHSSCAGSCAIIGLFLIASTKQT
jgi:hypothetical protein